VLPRWVTFAALVTGVAGDALAGVQSRQGTVDITVDVRPDAAHVEERYLLASSASPIALRVLTRPCATIENLALEQAGVVLAVKDSREGPWITFQGTIAAQGDSLRLFVRYDVRPAGTGVIPLVHLATAVTGNRSTRTGPVTVDVRVSDAAPRVSFPHMTRHAPNEWSARFVAVPSFVEIAGLRAAPCDKGGGEGGDNGGLVWRFFLLVGIMMTWVPLYLVWARRSKEREHT
jgi:hypothetical protein